MNIAYEINLDRINPYDIIDLHKKGIITLDEIIASGCYYSVFNNDLWKYVNSLKKLRDAAMPETQVISMGYDDMPQRRKTD